jgi:hypothetical protein
VEQGIPRVKMKIGRNQQRDIERVRVALKPSSTLTRTAHIRENKR